jgi:hypothetical protein
VNTNSTEQKHRVASTEETKRTGKKPYVKPEVRHERVFETMALSCGKIAGTQGSCKLNRKNS